MSYLIQRPSSLAVEVEEVGYPGRECHNRRHKLCVVFSASSKRSSLDREMGRKPAPPACLLLNGQLFTGFEFLICVSPALCPEFSARTPL
eukprot:scaffold61517_cov67-Cyclotella_meneghiniana.AAC.4